MIRINLVAEGKKPAAARPQSSSGGFGLDSENLALYALVAGFLIFAAVFGVWWFRLNSEIQANQKVIRAKQKRADELREIIERVEAFERRQELLTQKIDVITDLKNNQRGPVEIMDQVSRALPELLWVDRMNQTGDRVEIQGRTFNISSIATFVENLDNVPFFQEPILKRSTKGRGDVWSYTVEFQKIIAPAADPETAEAAG